jgi:hypothetical protein
MHYGAFDNATSLTERFTNHMLFQRPGQRFKVFELGEAWTVPED